MKTISLIAVMYVICVQTFFYRACYNDGIKLFVYRQLCVLLSTLLKLEQKYFAKVTRKPFENILTCFPKLISSVQMENKHL